MFFLYGDRESVVQALKTATRNFWQYWLAIVAAVLFFGGLLVKSYWEGYVFERDYKRLLKYYHHVTPGSINDGDVDGARYTAYKYRKNKKALWRKLEKKYGEPVLETWEYEKIEEEEAEKEDKEEEETVDLDDGDEKDNEGDAPDL